MIPLAAMLKTTIPFPSCALYDDPGNGRISDGKYPDGICEALVAKSAKINDAQALFAFALEIWPVICLVRPVISRESATIKLERLLAARETTSLSFPATFRVPVTG